MDCNHFVEKISPYQLINNRVIVSVETSYVFSLDGH